MKLKAYECRLRGSEHWSFHYAFTAGKARYQYFLDISDCCPDLSITQIDVRSAGGRAPSLSERLLRVGELRGLPMRLYRGMTIEVDGERGLIVDGNDSLNLDVCFERSGQTHNCHPTWETAYFDKSGAVVADYRSAKASAA